MRNTFGGVLLGLMLTAALGFGFTTGLIGTPRAEAASVIPSHIEGANNDGKNCSDINSGWIQLKVDPANGTYTDGYLTVTITNYSGTTNSFDWSSNIGVDAVVVKDGVDGANLYRYDPPSEAMSDTNLMTPFDGDKGISHINFCYDLEVTVTKTATTTYTSTCTWTIDKSVSSDTVEMFKGDSATVEYTVALDKSCTDSNFAVSGTITVDNDTPLQATITGVTDVLTGGINATVNCGVTFPYALAAGGTLNCTYTAALPDKTSRTNTATASTSGTVGGDSGTASVTFGAPTTVVNGTVNISDSVQGSLGSASDDKTIKYTRTFTCDGDEGTHNNTATIVETGQSDSASVTVTCYDLTVTKTATTSYDRGYTWTIDKSADQTSLTLTPGQIFTVNYSVTVNATSSDTNQAVSGGITVTNSSPLNARLNNVTDVVSPAIAATVNCGVTFPYTLAAGGTLNCTYTAALPDKTSRTNTATAVLQNYSYDKYGAATANGTTNFTGTASVTFGAPANITDECINVSDTNVGVLGTVCANEVPKTFTYSLTFGTPSTADVVLVCGSNTHPNTASFVTNDTGATGSDTWTVTANVTCNNMCTLTQGYWRTHSEFGPAPYDDTWALLSNGASTSFFLSGKTYYQVLWTAPAGNAYYILASQYIAAQLNTLNGATMPANVQTAYNNATTLLNTYTPAQIGALKGNSALRSQFVTLAGTLASFNEGTSAGGPAHCSQ